MFFVEFEYLSPIVFETDSWTGSELSFWLSKTKGLDDKSSSRIYEGAEDFYDTCEDYEIGEVDLVGVFNPERWELNGEVDF